MAGFVKNTYYVDAFKLQNKARALEKAEPSLLAEIMTGNRAVADLAKAINAAGPKRWKTVSLTWSPADVENLREAYKRNVVNKNFMYADLGSSANADSVTRPTEITPFTNRSSKKFKDAEAERLKTTVRRQDFVEAISPKKLREAGRKAGPKLRKINPLSSENVLIKTGTSFNAAVENNARMAHFLAANDQNVQLFKSSKAAMDASAQSVRKYLFDYSDLSSLEQQLFKRVAPFYTFTRKAIPLYLEKLVTNPGKFQRLEYAKNALVGKSEYQGEDISVWQKEAGALPLPNSITDVISNLPLVGPKFGKNASAVLVPDLPFKSLSTLALGVKKLFADKDVSGAISEFQKVSGIGGPAGLASTVLYDYKNGVNSFSGASMGDDDWTEVPVWAKYPPFSLIFGGMISKRRVDPNGPRVEAMRDRDIYLMESIMPALSKARTTFPTSAKDISSSGRRRISLLTGQSVYPTTKQSKSTAAYGRLEQLRSDAANFKQKYDFYPPESPRADKPTASLRPLSKKEGRKRLRDIEAGR